MLRYNSIDLNSADASGDTALLLAARQGNVEVSAILLNNGADVSRANKEGETALSLAKATLPTPPLLSACTTHSHTRSKRPKRARTHTWQDFNKTTLIPLLEAATDIRRLKMESVELKVQLAEVQRQVQARDEKIAMQDVELDAARAQAAERFERASQLLHQTLALFEESERDC